MLVKQAKAGVGVTIGMMSSNHYTFGGCIRKTGREVPVELNKALNVV